MSRFDFEQSAEGSGPLLGEHLNRYWAAFLVLGAFAVFLVPPARTTGLIFMAGGLGGLASGWVSALRHARRGADTSTLVLFAVFVAVAIPAYFLCEGAASAFLAQLSGS